MKTIDEKFCKDFEYTLHFLHHTHTGNEFCIGEISDLHTRMKSEGFLYYEFNEDFFMVFLKDLADRNLIRFTKQDCFIMSNELIKCFDRRTFEYTSNKQIDFFMSLMDRKFDWYLPARGEKYSKTIKPARLRRIPKEGVTKGILPCNEIFDFTFQNSPMRGMYLMGVRKSRSKGAKEFFMNIIREMGEKMLQKHFKR